MKNGKVIPGESAQHRMLVMEMKSVRKRMSPRETRRWKLNNEELRDAFISKAREHLCSLKAEGKKANWKETYSRIIQLAKIGSSVQLTNNTNLLINMSKKAVDKHGISHLLIFCKQID